MNSVNPFSLEGKTILVTGASSGIGQSIAIECSNIGANLIISGRDNVSLQQTYCQLAGDGHQMVIADLSNQNGIDSLVASSFELDGVVFSAGIYKVDPVKHLSRPEFEEILNINTIAPIMLLSSLIKEKKIHSNSSIVFLESLSGVIVGTNGESIYSTSKGALNGFVKSAALELASRGIRINAICPGLVPTNLFNNCSVAFTKEQIIETTSSKYPLKRIGKTEDIAYGAIYLLSDASSWITGIDLVIDGGYSLA